MGKSAIQQGKRAAVECKPGGHCYDGENRCVHCREHIADPHQPDCWHADEPDDECDARPADGESPVTVVISGWSGPTARVPGTREGLEEYVARRVPERYREAVLARMLAWLEGNPLKPRHTTGWHGDTETWFVEGTI